MLGEILNWLLGDTWEYGTAMGTRRARRHRRTGIVQVILWDASDWHTIDRSWWGTFHA